MHWWGQNMKYLRNQEYTHCAIPRILHYLKLLVLNQWGKTGPADWVVLCTFFIHCTWKHKGVDKMKLSKNLQDTDPVQWQYLTRCCLYTQFVNANCWCNSCGIALTRKTKKAWDGNELPKGSGIFRKMYIFFKTSQILVFFSNMAFSCASLGNHFYQQSIISLESTSWWAVFILSLSTQLPT